MSLQVRAGGLLAALALAACANLPEPAERIAPRAPVQAFELDGRFAARDGERSVAGTVVWTHSAGRDQLDFVAPTGQVMARLLADPGGAELALASGERRRAASLDELAQQALGVGMPVRRLRDWVQAAPGGAARVLRRDALGRPALISQDGWLVEYLAYRDERPDAAVRRLEAAWGELRINLVIDAWVAE